jgi:hypothetical protein
MQQRRDKDDRFAQALLAGADALTASAVLAAAATAELAAAMHAGPIANAYVIRGGEKPRYGSPNPNWRKSQFVQAAIVADYRNGPLPDKLNHTKLTDAVNARLRSDPEFSAFREKYPRLGGVTRQAVIAALRMLRRANP